VPDDGGPAFPKGFMAMQGSGGTVHLEGGMSLRAWLAGQALAGMCDNDRYYLARNPEHPEDCDLVGVAAVNLADAVLKALQDQDDA